MKYVIISGNIGSGKTTLTEMLCNYLGWQAFYENLDNNPYLFDFYENMKQWAFHLQITFLTNRYEQYKNIISQNVSSILDRSIYEDAYIFAENLYDMKLMDDRDYIMYRKIFKIIEDQLKTPDLMVYLRANVETLVGHIKKRGRDYEQNIDKDYIEALNKKYEKWYENYQGKKIIVDMNTIKFSENPESFEIIIKMLEKEGIKLI